MRGMDASNEKDGAEIWVIRSRIDSKIIDLGKERVEC